MHFIPRYYVLLDDKGTSLVFINTEKGNSVFKREDTNWIATSYEDVLHYNPLIKYSVHYNQKRDDLFSAYNSDVNLNELINLYTRPTTLQKIKTSLKSLKRLVGRTKL